MKGRLLLSERFIIPLDEMLVPIAITIIVIGSLLTANCLLFRICGQKAGFRDQHRWLRILWHSFYEHRRANLKLRVKIRQSKGKDISKGFVERWLLKILVRFPFISLFHTVVRWILLLVLWFLYLFSWAPKVRKAAMSIERDRYSQVDMTEVLLMTGIVFGHLLLRMHFLKPLIVVFACWRLIDMFMYLPAMVFFIRYRVYRQPLSISRNLILLISDYIQIILCFSLLYLARPAVAASVKGHTISSAFQSIYFSVVTITTLGYGDFCPINSYGRILVISEVLMGLYFILLVFAYFVQRLPLRDRGAGHNGRVMPKLHE